MDTFTTNIPQCNPGNSVTHHPRPRRNTDEKLYLFSEVPPKKYIKVNDIVKLNPKYKEWKEASQGGAPATSVPYPSRALPIVTNMDDYEQLNDVLISSGDSEIPLAESTSATIEMLQELDISTQAGMVRML